MRAQLTISVAVWVVRVRGCVRAAVAVNSQVIRERDARRPYLWRASLVSVSPNSNVIAGSLAAYGISQVDDTGNRFLPASSSKCRGLPASDVTVCDRCDTLA
jgi:hypothetical protein